MTEIKIITQHPGNLYNWEYGTYRLYRPVDVDNYRVIWETEPDARPFWCPVVGTYDICEDCSLYDEDVVCKAPVATVSCEFVETKLRKYIEMGYPYTESDGQIVIDVTSHEPVSCEKHPENGCAVCYPCREVCDIS